MTVRLIVGTVTHQSDITTTSELLDQPQRELLAVILDSLVGLIERITTTAELTTILPRKACPSDLALLKGREQPMTWTKVGHPHVITGFL